MTAREALRLLNWPPKQTKVHKHEYFKRGKIGQKTNNNMCSACACADTINNKFTYCIYILVQNVVMSVANVITLGHKPTTILTYSERIGMQFY